MLNLSRRELVLGAAATGVVASSTAGSAAPTFGPKTRPNVGSTEGNRMVALYAKAVAAMQDPALLYPPQPTSWAFQAYIHCVPSNPFDPANSSPLAHGSAPFKERIDQIYGDPTSGSPQEAWKRAALASWSTCTHFSPYFTAWHRWYLYYFERICRTMCGDPDFVLPYWDYASDKGSSLMLPAAFRFGSTQRGLVFSSRGLGFSNPNGTGPQNVLMNGGGYLPYPLTQYDDALAAKYFFPSDATYQQPPAAAYFAFGHSGRLECVPHDTVHGNIGGWMANVASAAGDPIFYVHHCQVDRLFASWQAASGRVYNWGTGPTDPPKVAWEGQGAHFVDEKGTLVTVTLGGALSTAALDYEYDALVPLLPVTSASADEKAATKASPSLPAVTMSAGPFRVGSEQGAITLRREQNPPRPAAASGSAAGTVLVLKNLKLETRPPAPLGVFLNLPKGTAPDLTGRYYVATINLFNVTAGEHPQMSMPGMAKDTPLDLSYDVGRILADQKAAKLWDGGPITVTITTLGAPPETGATYLTFDGVSLERR